MGDIIPLRPRSDAPIQRLPDAEPHHLFGADGDFVPREHFGRRVSDYPRSATGAELFNALDNERVKLAARKAAEEFALGGERKHVCPSLHKTLSDELAFIAEMLLERAKRARDLGHLRACASVTDMSGILEAVAAEIHPLPEGA